MVVTTIHGKRTLLFRVGNARGNEVVDASMNVTVLMDDVLLDHHFVDVISELPDGRLMVDYTKFHDTAPDDAAGESA